MLFGAALVQEVRICRATDDGVRQVFLDLHQALRGDTPRRVRFSGSGCEVDGRWSSCDGQTEGHDDMTKGKVWILAIVAAIGGLRFGKAIDLLAEALA